MVATAKCGALLAAAVATIHPTTDSSVANFNSYKGYYGQVYFFEYSGGTHIRGDVWGMNDSDEGKHGMHIHKFGVGAGSGNNCSATGPHYNPSNQQHGSSDSAVRHDGDLGNIKISGGGYTHVDYWINAANRPRINGENSILGRALMVHSGKDDVGQGSNADSKLTGNSGAKAACGNIFRIDETSAIASDQYYAPNAKC